MQIICKSKKLYETSKFVRQIIDNYEDIQEFVLELILDKKNIFREKIENEKYKNFIRKIIKEAFSSYMKMIVYSEDIYRLFSPRSGSRLAVVSLTSGNEVKFNFYFNDFPHFIRSHIYMSQDCHNVLEHSKIFLELRNFRIPLDFFYGLVNKIKKEISEEKDAGKNMILDTLDIIVNKVRQSSKDKNYLSFFERVIYLFDIHITVGKPIKKSFKIVFQVKNSYMSENRKLERGLLEVLTLNRGTLADLVLKKFNKKTGHKAKAQAYNLSTYVEARNWVEHVILNYIINEIIALYIKRESLLAIFSPLFDATESKYTDEEEVEEEEGEGRKYIGFEMNVIKNEKLDNNKHKSIAHKIIFKKFGEQVPKIIKLLQRESSKSNGFLEVKKQDEQTFSIYLPKRGGGALLCKLSYADLGDCYYIKVRLLDLQYLEQSEIMELLNNKLFIEMVSLLGISIKGADIIKRFIEIDFLGLR